MIIRVTYQNILNITYYYYETKDDISYNDFKELYFQLATQVYLNTKNDNLESILYYVDSELCQLPFYNKRTNIHAHTYSLDFDKFSENRISRELWNYIFKVKEGIKQDICKDCQYNEQNKCAISGINIVPDKQSPIFNFCPLYERVCADCEFRKQGKRFDTCRINGGIITPRHLYEIKYSCALLTAPLSIIYNIREGR